MGAAMRKGTSVSTKNFHENGKRFDEKLNKLIFDEFYIEKNNPGLITLLMQINTMQFALASCPSYNAVLNTILGGIIMELEKRVPTKKMIPNRHQLNAVKSIKLAMAVSEDSFQSIVCLLSTLLVEIDVRTPALYKEEHSNIFKEDQNPVIEH